MSYRQSLYPGGGVSTASANTPPSAAAINALDDKQRQVQHFHHILQHSQNLLQLYKGFTDQYNVLVGGSEAVGDVVEHWQNVFRSTALALGSVQEQKQALSSVEDTNKNPEHISLPRTAKPDQLVRLPVDSNPEHPPPPSPSPSSAV